MWNTQLLPQGWITFLIPFPSKGKNSSTLARKLIPSVFIWRRILIREYSVYIKWRLPLVERKLHRESAAQNPGFQFWCFSSEVCDVTFLHEFSSSWNAAHSPALDPKQRQQLSECFEWLFWFNDTLLFYHSYTALKCPPVWNLYGSFHHSKPGCVLSPLREVHRNKMTCAKVVRLLGGKGWSYARYAF